MEAMLELRPRPGSEGPGTNRHYTSAHAVWHPQQARGIYGGVLISQSLAAGQHSVPSNWLPRSMKCSFLKAGDTSTPISYHVRRVCTGEDGNTACSRVYAQQGSEQIFLATIQFSTHPDPKSSILVTGDQRSNMPEPPAAESCDDDPSRPFLIHESLTPSCKIVWLRSRSKIISNAMHTHLTVLAFLSDSFFITTTAQLLGLKMRHRIARAVEKGQDPNAPIVTMMVSLDHVMYFHEWDFRADDWIYVEMEMQWAGEGRALVRERMYDQAKRLIATCIQEGVLRVESAEAKI